MNLKNLGVLADLLETIPEVQFGMASYFDGEEPEGTKPFTQLNYCGTTACAVGHGPLAGFPKSPSMGWLEYSYKYFVFEGAPEDFDGDQPTLQSYGQADNWEWCFASGWSEIDNTPAGAVKRIRYFIKHGLPEYWENIMILEKDYWDWYHNDLHHNGQEPSHADLA